MKHYFTICTVRSRREGNSREDLRGGMVYVAEEKR